MLHLGTYLEMSFLNLNQLSGTCQLLSTSHAITKLIGELYDIQLSENNNWFDAISTMADGLNREYGREIYERLKSIHKKQVAITDINHRLGKLYEDEASGMRSPEDVGVIIETLENLKKELEEEKEVGPKIKISYCKYQFAWEAKVASLYSQRLQVTYGHGDEISFFLRNLSLPLDSKERHKFDKPREKDHRDENEAGPSSLPPRPSQQQEAEIKPEKKDFRKDKQSIKDRLEILEDQIQKKESSIKRSWFWRIFSTSTKTDHDSRTRIELKALIRNIKRTQQGGAYVELLQDVKKHNQRFASRGWFSCFRESPEQKVLGKVIKQAQGRAKKR